MTTALILAALWVALALFARWLTAPGLRDGEITVNASKRLVEIYARLIHRMRTQGRVFIPDYPLDPPRPIVVIANHTAGVDPILVQAALPFEVRWMMGADMRIEALDFLWEFLRIIFVSRTERSTRGVRDAIAHLKQNQVLGVFPEGHIERPPGALLPFQGGAATLIKKTNALVLPVCITGTPQVDPAWASIWTPSRTTLRFLPTIDYARTHPEFTPPEIANDLRLRFAEALQYPLNDNPPVFQDGQWIYPARTGEPA